MLYLVFRKKNGRELSLFADSIYRAQSELAGRLSQLNENNSAQQAMLAQAIHEQKISMLKIMDERLLAVTKNVGEGLQLSADKTSRTLNDLSARLAKIDAAQQKYPVCRNRSFLCRKF